MYLKNVLKKLNNLDEDFIDFNSPDQENISEFQIEFAKDFYDFMQGFIEKEPLKEEFTSTTSLQLHYDKHCLAGDIEKKSDRYNVYYDFNNIDKYRIYGDKISNSLEISPNRISSLLDFDKMIRYLRKLFEGNYYILFTTSCAFENDKGPVMIGLHAFSSDVTTNYKNQNTLDLIIISPTFKTISLYPVDAYYFKTKFNTIMKKFNKVGIRIKINY